MRFARHSVCVPIAAAVLLWMCGTASGQPAGKSSDVNWTEQRFAVQFHKANWSRVFEWLSDQTRLSFVSTAVIPPGSLTLISPAGRKHSLRELFDICNEALLQQGFVMVRNDLSFTVIAANERLNPSSVPRIKIEDLNNRGQTELVSVFLPLRTLTALRIQADIKKMMGPFGDVVAFDQANQLLLRDTVKSLKRIVATIDRLEKNYLQQAQTFSHKCKYIKATVAAEKTKEFLGEEKDKINVLDPGGKVLTIVRSHHVTASDETNTVHVNGPPEKIARAKLLLERLDVRVEPQSLAVLKTYTLDDDNAEKVAKALQGILKSKVRLRIEAISASSIMVYGQVDDHFSVARYIEGMRTPSLVTKVIPLGGSLDAVKTAFKLNSMYYSDTKTSVPYIDADTDANAIIVRGSERQVQEVDRTVRAMVGTPTSGMRVLTVPPGSARVLAQELQRLLSQQTNTPVRVIVPGQDAPQHLVPGK